MRQDEMMRRATPSAPAGERDGAALETLETLGARERLWRMGATVAAMGAALALDAQRLAAAETLDRLEATTTLTLDQLEGWSASAVEEWFATLGADAQLDLRALGVDAAQDEDVYGVALVEGAQLRAGRDPVAAWRLFTEAARSSLEAQGEAEQGAIIEARVAIAKDEATREAQRWLTAGHAADQARSRVFVWYQAEACASLFAPGALLEWERLGLAPVEERVTLALCDTCGYLAGVALDVIGVEMVAEPDTGSDDARGWLHVSRTAWRRFTERARAMVVLRDAESSWQGAPRWLTPGHLRVETRAAGLEALATRIATLRAILAAAMLASATQAHEETGALTLRFAGARPCTCQVAGVFTASAPGAATEQAGALAGGALGLLAGWAYDHASADKLAIARECLARELTPGGSVSLAALEHAARLALDAARANFALYLRRNTDAYFAARQQALDAVATYAASMRKAVSDLTTDVVETVYRTAGLLVGVVIAALLQPALSLGVQRLAAALYTLYLAFVIWFVLRARAQRFALEHDELDRRLAAMPELSASERERLRAPAASADQFFALYRRRSQVIYLALGAIGLLYLLALCTPLAPHLTLGGGHGAPGTTPVAATSTAVARGR